MYMRLKDGKSKVLTLSYDDGVVQDIRLSEIMKKYGLKGTFNINTGCYLAEEAQRSEFRGRMKLSEAKALYIGSGNEVAVHAYTHPFLERMNTQEIISEIMTDREHIERDYGCIARGMAYPFGTYDDRVLTVLKMCNIAYSRTVKSTHSFDFPDNWLTLDPTCHHKDPELMRLAQDFVAGDRLGRCQMFYLWGHSYEFDDMNNWNVIEEFAKLTGGREDVWYATNIEVYDYVQAYNSLVISIDKKTIYNPSATDVWAYDDGEVFCIKAGQTLKRQ